MERVKRYISCTFKWNHKGTLTKYSILTPEHNSCRLTTVYESLREREKLVRDKFMKGFEVIWIISSAHHETIINSTFTLWMFLSIMLLNGPKNTKLPLINIFRLVAKPVNKSYCKVVNLSFCFEPTIVFPLDSNNTEHI